MQKYHESDAYNDAILARAVLWTAFCQGGGRVKTEHETFGAAEESASSMAEKFKRPAIVYAVDSDGRSAVAKTIRPARSESPASGPFLTKADAQRNAYAAGLRPSQYDVSADDYGRFTWRRL